MPPYEKAVNKSRLAEVYAAVPVIRRNLEMCKLSQVECSPELTMEGLSWELQASFNTNGAMTGKYFSVGMSIFGIVFSPLNGNNDYGIVLSSQTDGTDASADTRGQLVCAGNTEKGVSFCKSICGSGTCDMEANEAV